MKQLIFVLFVLLLQLNLTAQLRLQIQINNTRDSNDVIIKPEVKSKEIIINKDDNNIVISNKTPAAISVLFTQKDNNLLKKNIIIKPNDSDVLVFNSKGALNADSVLFSGNVEISFKKLNEQKSFFRNLFSFKLNNVSYDDKNSKSTSTGIPVYDAVLISNLYNGNINPQVQAVIGSILKSYACNDKDCSWQDLKKLYASNQFISPLLDSIDKKIQGAISESEKMALDNISSSVLSSIGGLDVTSFADAFAKFIVKRTKQELNIAFFDKFKQFITKYPDLQTVFPQTYITLNIIGDEIYNYQAYLQTLRESFENDLSALNKNLPTIIDNHPDFFHQHPELAATLNSGCYIAGALQDKVHPGDILNNYPAGYLDSLNKNWKGAIQTLQLFSNSLRDTATNTDSVYWVSSKQINQLVNNATAFKIYLGLVYQDAKNKYAGVHYDFKGKDTTLVQILNALPFDSIYTSYKNFVARFSEKTDNLNMMIKNYRKAGNDSLAYQQYYDYFNSSISLLKQCTEISKLPYLKERLPNLAEAMKDYFDVAQSSAKLVLDVNRRNYASAVVNAVHIYDVIKTKHTSSLKSNKQKNTDELVSKDIDDKIKKAANNETVIINNNTINNAAGLTAVTKITDDYNKRQIKQADDNIAINLAQRAAAGEIIKLDSTILDSLRRTTLSLLYNKIADDTLKKLYKYGTFMATIVQAKSSDDIENAIEAFALPAGSSRIKRESLFNVSLNAYAGVYAGYERIKGFDKNQFKINSFGVAAPVGIAASIGARKFLWTGNETRNHWSYTMFVSLIDLGAVAAFRFNNDSTVIKNNNTEDTLSASQSSSIQLKNIVSPGLFLSIGIPKSPLSVNFGAQLGPNLRSITSTNGTAKLNFGNNIYWRYSISLVVDIPVLNFYTKSK